VFHYAMNGVEISYTMPAKDSFSLRVAVGTYTWWVTNDDGSPASWENNTSITGIKVVSQHRTIDFGWVQADTGPVDPASIWAGYVVFFAILAAVFAVVLGLMIRNNGVQKIKKLLDGNPNPKLKRGRY